MTTPANWVVRRASWNADRKWLQQIRRTVFIEEQRVPESLEWDEHERDAWHVLALDAAGSPIATGRLQRDGKLTLSLIHI